MTRLAPVVCCDQRDHDPAWDAFAVQVPGGHHVQTSLWAQVKRVLGWQAARITLRREEEIVGGAQVLYRRLARFWHVGYVTNGPLTRADASVHLEQLVSELRRFSRRKRMVLLTVQPPKHDTVLVEQLPRWGFRSGRMAVAPTASVVIDLSIGLEHIMARMHPSTRQGIRRGLRRGVEVHQGAGDDIPRFYALHVATSRRQGFVPYPLEYFTTMWRVLHEYDYIRLFIAQVKGEDVAAQVVVPFADTVISKMIGWSGTHSEYQPNRVLDWAVIQWAADAGYRFFDLEGINPDVARLVLAGQPLPKSHHNTTTAYKLGFGGQVVLYPGPYDHCYCPPLHWVYHRVAGELSDRALLKRVVGRIQGRRATSTDAAW